jgi:NADH-quinone oxidoreductase subunit L
MSALFPANDFSLIAIILALPLLGAFVNGIWGKRLGKPAVKLMALAAMAGSFFAAVFTFVALADQTGEHEHVRLTWTAWEWMHTTGGLTQSPVAIDMRFSVDALSGTMMLIVTGVGFLIHLYSTAYMADDPGFARFFAYLNLFVFAMLVLILGDNMPVMFVGWEGVGLCSYLLIGFWFEHLPNATAGKKAFIANRIGDFGLLCAMFLLVHYTGSLDWVGMSGGAHTLADTPGDAFQIHIWPPGGGSYPDIHLGALTLPLHYLNPTHNGTPTPFTMTAATAVGLALLLGCTGKSAQIPLYVWLPDAMAGPTPVSALIHAATMVTAGVYLVCRMSFVFVLSPFVMACVAGIGAATAILAASIALVQNDIKKVLAYSTVSQLGFMFIGVGVGAFTAGFFHVITHAFFKACLFLGAGSVIHAMHARIHDDDAAQDMRNMGGLGKYMPYTRWTFLVSTLAIAGCPGLAGFFSKDEILKSAYVNLQSNPVATHLQSLKALPSWTAPSWYGPMLYWVGLAAATMTAFYMFRAYFLTFEGDFRGWTLGRPSQISAHDHASHDDEDGHHHEENLKEPGRPPHESPRAMTLPLIVLATFAALAGILNPAPLPKKYLALDHWLEPVFEEATRNAISVRAGGESLTWILAVGGIMAFLVGSGVAYWMYMKEHGEPARKLAAANPGIYRLLLDKWRVDELYDWAILSIVDALADTFAIFDSWFVDGLIAKVPAVLVAGLGSFLRIFQTGVVHSYAAVMVVGMACFGWFFVTPHPNATVVESNGDYTITAGPGIGYQYRWDADSNGTYDSDKYSDQTTVKVHVDAGKSKTVKLEVKNAFDLKKETTIELKRPEAAQVLEVGAN